MRKALRRSLSIGLSIFWAALGAGAQKPATTPEQAPLVLRSTTQLVQVNVIARDKEGRPVADLTADDFTLTDDGEAQHISVFSVEKSHAVSGTSALPPGVFSNRWEDRRGAPTSVTLILLDAVNTAFPDQAYSHEQLLHFLKQIQPNDRIAIYAMGRNLRMLHDFSNDAESLSRSLAAYQGEIPVYLDSNSLEPLARTGRGGNAGRTVGQQSLGESGAEQERNFYITQRAEKTIASLEAIAEYLARLPGRKNLIWVSSGFPFSLGYTSSQLLPDATHWPSILSRQIERGARALNNANLAIYPVDARGLMVDPRFSATERRSIEQINSVGLEVGQEEIATMQELADRTGGRAFYNTNGIAEAIQQALDDGRVSYALAYYPTHGKWDGKFHKIKVNAARPGIQLRYRFGYFALPEQAPTDDERKAALQDVASSPLDATGLGLTAQVAPAGNSLNVRLRVDPGRITLQPQAGRWVGDLEFLWVQLSSDGHILKGVSQSQHMNLKQETYDRIRRDGITLAYPVEVLSGTEQIRVVVRDSPSGAMGSLSIPARPVIARPGA